jgi:hypothetical protein
MCSMDSASPSTHGSHLDEPYDMHPRMILDTLSPDNPRRAAWSAFQTSGVMDTGAGTLTVRHLFLN